MTQAQVQDKDWFSNCSNQQKTKRWFKRKKLNYVRSSLGFTHFTRISKGMLKYHKEAIEEFDEDFTNINYTLYGGINHTNRDRKGGHIEIGLADYTKGSWSNELHGSARKYAKKSNRVLLRRSAKAQILEGLQEVDDDILDQKLIDDEDYDAWRLWSREQQLHMDLEVEIRENEERYIREQEKRCREQEKIDNWQYEDFYHYFEDDY